MTTRNYKTFSGNLTFLVIFILLGLAILGSWLWINFRPQPKPTQENIFEGVEYIRDVRELGFVDIPFSKLVELGIHHVTPGFIREAREILGEGTSIDKLIEMRIHGISPQTYNDFQAHGVEIEA